MQVDDPNPGDHPAPIPTITWLPGSERKIGRIDLRVRYAETDRMGIVYNANYLTWFEIGRTEFMRGLGVPYRSVEEKGYQLPLIEADLRIRAPIGYDDTISLEVWVDRIRSRVLTFRYRILHKGNTVAEGSSSHACVRAADGRSVALPDWVRQSLGLCPRDQ